MPYSSSSPTASAAVTRRPTRKANEDMEIKIKDLVRRQMVYGFESEKDGEGQIIGSSVVKLARLNAF
jgi:hypothetical protein